VLNRDHHWTDKHTKMTIPLHTFKTHLTDNKMPTS